MPVTLNLGAIEIDDQEVVKFLQKQNMDEIRKMFVGFLKSQISPKRSPTDLESRLQNLKIVYPEKAQRVKNALDELNNKLKPLKEIDIAAEKERYLYEKFGA